jgi:DNA (cytosine-5)-methyltransferase 1
MDYIQLNRNKLLSICKELNINSCSGQKKAELIKKIEDYHDSKSKKVKFVDLFCGIGGFHQALKRNENFECVMACDIDEKCRETYFENYGIMPEKDIKTINEKELSDFDILTAGFPCQTFSNAGKKGNLSDKRGQLFEDILRIATEKQPKFMFLENVKHIKRIDNGKTFEHIIKRINESGYYVEDNKTIFELSPHQLGIPQQRERVIFVCIRNDIYDKNKNIELVLPKKEIDFSKILEKDSSITHKYRISTELENVLNIWDEIIKKFDTNEILSPTILCNEFQKKYSEEEFASLASWKQDYIKKNKPLYYKYKSEWDTWYEKNKDILNKREIYCKLEWQVGKKKENDSIWNYFIQFRQSGIRVKKAHYFPTLVAIVQTPIYAAEKRFITPRECARLQSFPDDFIIPKNDKIAYKQFGNAVNVDVVGLIMNTVFRIYNIV